MPSKKKKNRPLYIDLKTTWKLPYGIGLGKRASVVHIVDQVGSALRYYPRVGTIQCKLRWVCLPSWSMPKQGVELLSTVAATGLLREHAEWRWCQRCFTILNERDERANK